MKAVKFLKTLAFVGVSSLLVSNSALAYGTLTSGTFDTPPNDEELAEWYAVYKVGDKYIVEHSPMIAGVYPVVCARGNKSVFHKKASDGTPENYLEFSSPTDKYITFTSDDENIASADKTAFYCNNVGRTVIHIDTGVYSPDRYKSSMDYDVIVYDVEVNDENIRDQVVTAIDRAMSVLANGGAMPESIDEKTAQILYDIMVTGKPLNANLGVELITKESLSEENRNKIEEKIGSGDKIVSYYDINIETEEENIEGAGHLKKLDGNIEVVLDLPELEKPADGYTRKFFAVRIHDGVAEKIEVSVQGNKGRMMTDRFSVYALGYTDVIGAPDTGVNTGENHSAKVSYGIAIITGVTAATGCLWYILRKRNQ